MKISDISALIWYLMTRLSVTPKRKRMITKREEMAVRIEYFTFRVSKYCINATMKR